MSTVVPLKTTQNKLIAEAIRAAEEIGPIRPYAIWMNGAGKKRGTCAPWDTHTFVDSKSIEHAISNPHENFNVRPINGYAIATDNLIVLDADGQSGMKTLAGLQLPETRRVQSQSKKGEHVIYKNTSGHKFTKDIKKVFEGIDIICGPNVIFGPGSQVDGGGEYSTIDDSPVADAPAWLIERLLKAQSSRPNARKSDILSVPVPLVDSALETLDPDCDYGTWIEIGMALDSGGHGEKWTDWSSKGAKYQPGECDKLLNKFDPQGGITLATLFHHAREAGWECDVQLPYWQNDLGNSERLALLVADRVRHISDVGTDYVWTSLGWQKDKRNTLHNAFDQVIDALYLEARALPKGIAANAAFRHAKSSGNVTRVKAACEFARLESPIRTLSDEWDANGSLITFSCGTVLDVRTMESRPMQRGDLIRRRINAPFNLDAKCPEFEYLINHLVDGDKDARAWLLQLWSTGLTGDVLLSIILVVWGASKSGKTTTVEILKRVLGEYACSPAPEFIIKPKYPNSTNAPNAEIINLIGRRSMFIAEFPPGRLDENKIKTLTGGDTLSVRRLYSNEFIDVRCRLTMTISSNSKPFFDATDAGMLRRVRAIHIRSSLDFKNKPERLNAIDWIYEREAAGIAALLVCSLREFIDAGEVLPESERIEIDTAALNLANDRVRQFLMKRCLTGEDKDQGKADLYRGYEKFCQEEGHKPFSRRRFHEVMREVHGFRETKRIKGFDHYVGVEEMPL